MSDLNSNDHINNINLHVDLDVGNLCVLNAAPLELSFNKNFSESALKRISSHGVEKLLNAIFKLPSEYHEHVRVAKLPEPITIIPREKPVPKPKPLSRWEKFAKTKGIKNQTKEKLVWDETSKEWKPQYGYRGINNKSDWLIEIPDNADPNIDYFGKKKKEKTEKIAKNEYQRLRNIADAQKLKVTNLESVDAANKEQLSRSLAAAKTATASVGRFANKLPKEKPPKNMMKKRKFKPNIPSNMKDEKENNLKIFEELEKKKPKLVIEEAVQRYITKPLKEERQDSSRQPDKKKKRSKRNIFIKNLFRGGKKNKKIFKREGK